MSTPVVAGNQDIQSDLRESGVSNIDRPHTNLGSSINRTPTSSIPQPGRIMKIPNLNNSRSTSFDPMYDKNTQSQNNFSQSVDKNFK